MNLPTSSPPKIDESLEVVACIYGSNLDNIRALREFLESNSVRVIYNKMPHTSPRYIICYGDMASVNFISEVPMTKLSLRILLATASLDSLPTDALEAFDKIIYCGNFPILPSEVSDIVSFLFSSDDQMFRLKRHEQHMSAKPSIVTQEVPSSRSASKVVEHIESLDQPEQEEQLGEGESDTFVSPHALTEQIASFYSSNQEAVVKARREEQQVETLIGQQDPFDKAASLQKEMQSQASVASLVSQIYQSDSRKNSGPAVFFRVIFFALLGCSALMVLSSLFFLATLGISICLLFASVSMVSSAPLQASHLNSVALQFLKQDQNYLTVVEFVAPGLEKEIQAHRNVLTALMQGATIVQSLASVVEPVSSTAKLQNLLESSSTNKLTIVRSVSSALSDVSRSTLLLSATLQKLVGSAVFPYSSFANQTRIDSYINKMQVFESGLETVQNALALYPLVGGFKNKQTYLVLFQNSDELRPSGGFIGSVGLVSVEDGAVSDFTIQNVYEIDGQLKGHVDPPKMLSRILGQEHWYLRDSNWNADFRESGARAMWFYESITGVKVDGVIGVTSLAVKDLLAVLGPVEVKDYSVTITSDNFFQKSYEFTKDNFFPGSSQKQNFLGALVYALEAKLTDKRTFNNPELPRLVSRFFLNKSVQLVSTDPLVMELLTAIGWSGAQPSVSGCFVSGDGCIRHAITFTEANLGVNKVNAYIERSTNRSIDILDGGDIVEHYTRTWSNTSKAGDLGGGEYVMYSQLMLPGDATLEEVRFNGIILSPYVEGKNLPYIETLERSIDEARFGIGVRILPGQTGIVSFTIRRIGAFPHLSKRRFELVEWKQAGTSPMPMTVSIRYPKTWNESHEEIVGIANSPIIGKNDPFIAKTGSLEYNTTIDGNHIIPILFEE